MPVPVFRSILIPTDFTDDAAIAFAHALKLALATGADLDIFHVEPDNVQADWHWAPNVVGTLVRWGVLPAGSTAADLERRGIRVHHEMAAGVAADEAILREVSDAHADLVVLATHGRAGLLRWLQPSVATPVALQGVVPVLLLPPRAKGFVDRDTGAATLRNVLLPIDARPHPEPGFDLIKTIARALRSDVLKVATLHVGSGTVETELLQPDGNWRVRHLLDEGPVVDRIIEHALDANADLVVCVTEGRRGFLDTLRGSTVERLIERIRVPVLIVPSQD